MLRRLVGAELTKVHYCFISNDEPGYRGREEGVDCDLAAVRLGFAGRYGFVVTWATLGEIESLSVANGDVSMLGPPDHIVDASHYPEWRRHLGSNIVSLAASWQGDSYESESLWALRLEFLSGSAVIALGGFDAEVYYEADELVAIFDPSIARSYRPAHIGSSAWGVPLDAERESSETEKN